MYIQYFDILNAVAGLLSFLIFFIHWINNNKPSLPNLLFRIYLFASCYYYIVAAVIIHGSIIDVPHLFRTGSIAACIFTPLIYLISIKSLNNKPWKKYDYLHFLPALFYIIDFSSFFVLPAETKIQTIALLQKQANGAIWGFKEGLISRGAFWPIVKITQALAYSICSLTILFRTVRRGRTSFMQDNKKLIMLLFWLSFSLLVVTLPLGLSFANLMGSNGWKTTSIISFSTTLITCLFFLCNPEVLYGLKGIWITNQDRILIDSKNTIPAKNAASEIIENPSFQFNIDDENYATINSAEISEKYLNVKLVRNMEQVLHNYLKEKQSYLQQGFSLPQLAKETNFQLQQVSAFLNQYKKENFNDYINKFRINHLLGLFEQDPTIIDQFTLEHLSRKIGFGSRSTFINSFKKFTGQTPSAYFSNRL